MSTIKTITPVHISSEQTFFVIKKNNYIYSLDKLIDKLVESKKINISNLRKLINTNNPSQQDLIDILNLNSIKLEEKDAVSTNKEYGKNASEKGNITQNVKYFEYPYIPASSLKGAFVNIFWFNFIKNNQDVQDYLIRQDKNWFEKIVEIDNKIKFLRTYFIVNDIKFSKESVIYNIKRYNKIKVLGFNCNIETIDENIEQSCEIVKTLSEQEEKKLLDLKNELLNENIDNNIVQKAIEQLYNYIIHFKKIFPKANKEFMEKVIIKEQSFVHSCQNVKIDTVFLKNFYKKRLEDLNSNKIIMQIGKYTNYVDKSFSVAFNKYDDNFILFSPSSKKKVSSIETMNFITISDRGILPLGFIELVF